MTALDIPELQIAVRYRDDENFEYHWRVLVNRIADARWAGATPDLHAQIINLAELHVIPLTRGQPVPARVRASYYGPAALSDQEMAEIRRECAALAMMHGAAAAPAAAAASAAEWRFADPAFTLFGDVVDPAIIANPNLFVSRDATALVQVDEDGETLWTTAERLSAEHLEEWKEEKRTGPGRDPRILPTLRDSRRARYRDLRSAMGEMTWVDPKAGEKDWPFDGPSAVKELLHAVRASGEELGGFHDYWVRSCGIGADSQISYKHRDLLAVLLHLNNFDQLNLGELAGAEHAARLVLQIHSAVKKNPKAPDFKGTGVMVASKLDSAGGVLTGDFARYVAEEQRTHACALKQQRLFAEEEEKRAAKKKDKDK